MNYPFPLFFMVKLMLRHLGTYGLNMLCPSVKLCNSVMFFSTIVTLPLQLVLLAVSHQTVTCPT